MTYKQIEASREARLWLTQLVLPVITVVLMVPETRNAVIAEAKNVKKSIKAKFERK